MHSEHVWTLMFSDMYESEKKNCIIINIYLIINIHLIRINQWVRKLFTGGDPFNCKRNFMYQFSTLILWTWSNVMLIIQICKKYSSYLLGSISIPELQPTTEHIRPKLTEFIGYLFLSYWGVD